jgi:hypothetical protein
MSSHRIPPSAEDHGLDSIDELIRWSLLDEMVGEEPSRQTWQRIQAKLATRSQTTSSQPGVDHPWWQFASVLYAWVWGTVAPLDANWDSRIAPKDQPYLMWRETFPLSVSPTISMIIC